MEVNRELLLNKFEILVNKYDNLLNREIKEPNVTCNLTYMDVISLITVAFLIFQLVKYLKTKYFAESHVIVMQLEKWICFVKSNMVSKIEKIWNSKPRKNKSFEEELQEELEEEEKNMGRLETMERNIIRSCDNTSRVIYQGLVDQFSKLRNQLNELHKKQIDICHNSEILREKKKKETKELDVKREDFVKLPHVDRDRLLMLLLSQIDYRDYTDTTNTIFNLRYNTGDETIIENYILMYGQHFIPSKFETLVFMYIYECHKCVGISTLLEKYVSAENVREFLGEVSLKRWTVLTFVQAVIKEVSGKICQSKSNSK